MLENVAMEPRRVEPCRLVVEMVVVERYVVERVVYVVLVVRREEAFSVEVRLTALRVKRDCVGSERAAAKDSVETWRVVVDADAVVREAVEAARVEVVRVVVVVVQSPKGGAEG